MKKLIIFLILTLFISELYAGPWKECTYPTKDSDDPIGQFVCWWIDLPAPLEYSLDFTTTLGVSYLGNRLFGIRKAKSDKERLELSLFNVLVGSVYVAGKNLMLFTDRDPNGRWDNAAFDMLAVGTGFALSYWNKGYFWIAPKEEKNKISGIQLNFAFNF